MELPSYTSSGADPSLLTVSSNATCSITKKVLCPLFGLLYSCSELDTKIWASCHTVAMSEHYTWPLLLEKWYWSVFYFVFVFLKE